MTTVTRRWKHLSSDDHWELVRYLIGSIWAATLFFYTPLRIAETVAAQVIFVIMVMTIIGGVVAAIGRGLSLHLAIELPGLLLLLSGVVVYLIIQAVLSFYGDEQRIALSVFAFWLLTSYLDRLFFLFGKWGDALELPRLLDRLRRKGSE